MPLQCHTAHGPYDRPATATAARYQQRCFGHTVAGVGGLRIETEGNKGLRKAPDGGGANRLGAIEGNLPAGKIDAQHLVEAKAVDAVIESEVRRPRHLGPIVADRAQPDQRAMHEGCRRQENAAGTDVKRLQRVQDQAHVVVERNPTHVSGRFRIVVRDADHLEVAQEIAVRDDNSFRHRCRSRGVLQESGRLIVREGAHGRLFRSIGKIDSDDLDVGIAEAFKHIRTRTFYEVSVSENETRRTIRHDRFT